MTVSDLRSYLESLERNGEGHLEVSVAISPNQPAYKLRNRGTKFYKPISLHESEQIKGLWVGTD